MNKYYISLIAILMCYKLLGQTEDIYIENMSVYFDEVSCFTGSFFDYSDGELAVNSELCFVNFNEIDVELLPTSDLGRATINFTGSANSFLNTSNNIDQLIVGLSGADLYLTGELQISSLLALYNGRLIGGDYDLVYITNSQASAIENNNSVGNTSYVAGKIQRTVEPEGASYIFPVGDMNAYHPIIISNVDTQTNLLVYYDSDIDDYYNDSANTDYEFSTSGGWLVNYNGFTSFFNVSLSLLDQYGNLLSGRQNLFYTDYPFFFSSNPIIDKKSTVVDNFFILGSERYSKGMFSLTEYTDEYIYEYIEGEWVNFIIKDGTSESLFIIPHLENFEVLKIKIYNSIGALIFKSDNYTNNFDAREFKSGTYYYLVEALLKDGMLYNKKGIIEIVTK